ncbi:hypothetical protein [Aliamphritea spongicola]|nr:hypothetical protein [Aliamphritea spongicola]
MSQTDKFFDHSEVEFAAEAMRKAGVIYDDLLISFAGRFMKM